MGYIRINGRNVLSKTHSSECSIADMMNLKKIARMSAHHFIAAVSLFSEDALEKGMGTKTDWASNESPALHVFSFSSQKFHKLNIIIPIYSALEVTEVNRPKVPGFKTRSLNLKINCTMLLLIENLEVVITTHSVLPSPLLPQNYTDCGWSHTFSEERSNKITFTCYDLFWLKYVNIWT